MHALFIRRCMELAENGRGKVAPNPLVGCVIVSGGSVIAEGWHDSFGGAHAERRALLSAGEFAKDAVLYVNLEPCCTQGKQPPCTEAILSSGIRTIVFGARDPSNAGREHLKGVEVIGPILEAECRHFNRGFFSLQEQGMPWVTLKKAMMRNGQTKSAINEPRLFITTEEQNIWAHTHLRARHDAILVGSGTIVADNPQLTVRHGSGPSPVRIILDPHGEISKDATVLTDGGKTIVIREKLSIPSLLERLKEEGIASVLVEGGEKIWQSFEESGCIDETVTLVR